MAFQMKRIAEMYKINDEKIMLKIGIHRGPVISGVIGKHKP